MSNLRLPFDDEPDSRRSRIDARDRAGRARAVDPAVQRRPRSVGGHRQDARAGGPLHQPAACRRRSVEHPGDDVHAQGRRGDARAHPRPRCAPRPHEARFRRARWRELRDRIGDIAISTIDAFCLSLLREFPLEADLDPGFSMADDTEVPRLVDESLDRALRICRALAREDEHVALVFAQLGDRRAARRAGGAAAAPHRGAGRARAVSGAAVAR